MIAKVTVAIGIVLFVSGCDKQAPTMQYTQTFDLEKQHIVKHYKDAYYYRPNNAWSYKLSANSANLNNVASSGNLKCQENSIWFISKSDRSSETKIRYKYLISLSKSDLNKMEEEENYIPRRDSQEFGNLIEIDTQMVKQGLIGCSNQIPKGRIENILPQGEVLSIPQ